MASYARGAAFSEFGRQAQGIGARLEAWAVRQEEQARYKAEQARLGRAETRQNEQDVVDLVSRGYVPTTGAEPGTGTPQPLAPPSAPQGRNVMSRMVEQQLRAAGVAPAAGAATPPAPASLPPQQAQATVAPPLSFGGRQYAFNPGASNEVRTAEYAAAQQRAQRDAEVAALTQQYINTGLDPATAQARAWGDVRNIDTSYKAFTRGQQMGDRREIGEIGDVFAARESGRSYSNAARLQSSSQAFQAGQNALDRNNQQELAGLRGSGRPLTEAENKNAGYLVRAMAAADIIDGYGAPPPAQGLGRVPLIGNYALTPAQQQFRQAVQELNNAVLRRESGATVHDQEYERQEQMMIPQPGDSREVLAAKALARRRAIEGIRLGAGRAAAQIEGGGAPQGGRAPNLNVYGAGAHSSARPSAQQRAAELVAAGKGRDEARRIMQAEGYRF